MNLSELKSKLYYGYVMSLLGFMVIFIALVIKNNCSSLYIIPITKALGVTRTAYVFHLSIMAIAMMISCFFMGRIISKFKLKYVMSICYLILAICYVCFSQVTALWQIYVIAAVMGFAFGGATTLPVNIMINNWFGFKVKGTMQSAASLGSGLGALVLVNLFQYIVSSYDWRIANLAAAAIFLVIMIPMVFFIAVDKPEERGYTRRPGDPVEEDHTVLTGISEANRGIDLKYIWGMKRFWLQSLGQILIVACSTAIATQTMPYFVDLGMKPAAAAALYSGAMGTLMFGKLILGFISDKIQVPRASFLASLCMGGSFLSLYFMGGSSNMSTVFMATFLIGGSVSTIIPPLLTAKNYGDKDFGSIMGVITMEGNVGQIIGPLLATFIYDTTGSYQSAWLIYTGITLVVAFSFYFSGSLSRKKAALLGYQ